MILCIKGLRDFEGKFPLREKYPNTEFFLVRIFLYFIEYGDLRSKSPYSVRIKENTDQKESVFGFFFTHCLKSV